MADKEALAKVCNSVDRRYLSDRLPFPYTESDAGWWINMVEENDEKTGLWRVIYVDELETAFSGGRHRASS